jgi:hypothetical protein
MERDLDLDFGKELGAAGKKANQRLTLYIPNKDQVDGLIADHDKWVKEAQELLTKIGKGATAFPPVDGTWEKPDGGVLWESTRIIYTFIDPDRLAANLKSLREFLHRFGRKTNQGEVKFEFDGWMWTIAKFDPPLKGKKKWPRK